MWLYMQVSLLLLFVCLFTWFSATASSLTAFGFYVWEIPQPNGTDEKIWEIQTGHPYQNRTEDPFNYNCTFSTGAFLNYSIRFDDRSKIRSLDYMTIISTYGVVYEEQGLLPQNGTFNVTDTQGLIVILTTLSNTNQQSTWGLLFNVTTYIGSNVENDDPSNDPSSDTQISNTNAMMYVSRILVAIVALLLGLLAFCQICSYSQSVKHFKLILSGRSKNKLKHFSRQDYRTFLANLMDDPYIGQPYLWIGMGYYEDLLRVIANCHPLFSCILADEENYFGSKDRSVIFYISSCLSFLFLSVVKFLSSILSGATGQIVYGVLSFLVFPFVTFVFDAITKLLLVCPCLLKYDMNISSMSYKVMIAWKILVHFAYVVAGMGIVLGGSVVFMLSIELQNLTNVDAAYNANVVVTIVFVDFFLVVVLFRGFTDVLFKLLLFVDITQQNNWGLCLRTFNYLTCGTFHIGSWYRKAKQWDFKPRIHLSKDQEDQEAHEKELTQRLEEVNNPLQIAKLERRISELREQSGVQAPGFKIERLSSENGTIVPGFPVDDRNDQDSINSSDRLSAKGAVPGFGNGT